MKLKVWLSVGLCACAMAFAAACSKAPDDVAVKFCENLFDGNASAAKDYCTPDSKEAVPMYANKIDETWKGASVKAIDTTVNGDTAIVVLEFSKNGKQRSCTFELKKIDGDWKVEL